LQHPRPLENMSGQAGRSCQTAVGALGDRLLRRNGATRV
jgi:hypothetical protein